MATNYDQEILGAEQQRMTSEALRQAANKPLEGQMVSGWYVPPSWTQYAAKGLESYLAGKEARDAKTQSATLREQKQKAIADMLKSYPTERNEPAYNSTENIDRQKLAMALTGQEQTQSPAPQAGGNVTVKPTNHDYMKWAIDANQVDPSTAQMGLKMFEADANRKAAEAKTQEDRSFREQMLNAQFQQQKELAKMRPQGLVQVDMNGNPVFMRQSDAVGEKAFLKPSVGKGAPLTPQQIDQASLTAQQTLNQLQKLNDHPGRLAGTGASSFMGVIPATDAKGFSSELKTFQSKAFLDAVQAMKGLGALTEAEGARLVSSIGALDPAMKEEDFAANLKSVAQEIYDKAKAKGLEVQLPNFAMSGQPVQNQPSAQQPRVMRFDAQGNQVQ